MVEAQQLVVAWLPRAIAAFIPRAKKDAVVNTAAPRRRRHPIEDIILKVVPILIISLINMLPRLRRLKEEEEEEEHQIFSATVVLYSTKQLHRRSENVHAPHRGPPTSRRLHLCRVDPAVPRVSRNYGRLPHHLVNRLIVVLANVSITPETYRKPRLPCTRVLRPCRRLVFPHP